MKIGVAILGVGRWGIHLVRHFQAQAHVRAIADPHPDRLASIKEHIPDSVILATSWSDIRQLKGIDAVVVATPASTHYPLIADALGLGYHVLAEKPLALAPKECLELTRLAARQQRQLMVDHTYLFHPAVERGRGVIESKALGALRYGYASRTHLGPVRQDVDALWDLAIHDIAIFNTWLGQMPIQVQANGRIWLRTEPPLADLVWATLFYPSGFQAHLHLCWLNPDKQRRLTVVGSQGSLIFDELSPTPLILQRGSLQPQGDRFVPSQILCEALPLEADEPLRRVCERFLANILAPPTQPISDGWMGTQLVQILTSLSQSLRQGEIVPVPPLEKTVATRRSPDDHWPFE